MNLTTKTTQGKVDFTTKTTQGREDFTTKTTKHTKVLLMMAWLTTRPALGEPGTAILASIPDAPLRHNPFLFVLFVPFVVEPSGCHHEDHEAHEGLVVDGVADSETSPQRTAPATIAGYPDAPLRHNPFLFVLFVPFVVEPSGCHHEDHEAHEGSCC